MGFGDELMAAGQARAEHARTSRRVEIVDRHGRRRWSALWEGVPYIARPGERGFFHRIANGGHCRPYIDYARSTPQRWAWRDFVPTPAELPAARKDLRGYGSIVIDPTIKINASPNKRWPWWQRLVDAAPDLPWLQVGPPGVPALRGVRRVETSDFLAGAGVLAAARAAVLHEGGLHHAAAALGVRAVVIYGGFTSPAQTGYELHRNLAAAGEACGWRTPCAHCETAMRAIPPDEVLRNLMEIFQ